MKFIKENNGIYTYELYDSDGKVKEITHVPATSKEDAETKINNRPVSTELQKAKRQKIAEIKKEANNKIDSEYPAYKQRNFQLGLKVNGYDNATKKQEMKTFLEGVIIKSEQLETQVNEMTDIDKIKNLEVTYI